MTPYKEVYEAFLDRIARDTTFFIKSEDEGEVIRVANHRMRKLLHTAVYRLMLSDGKRNCEINFIKEMDDENDTFLIELNLVEIQLFAELMFQSYVREEVIVRIDAMKRAGFQDSEIKIILHSPANSLKEYNVTFELLKSENNRKIDNYKKRSRDTLEYKSFNFGLE